MPPAKRCRRQVLPRQKMPQVLPRQNMRGYNVLRMFMIYTSLLSGEVSTTVCEIKGAKKKIPPVVSNQKLKFMRLFGRGINALSNIVLIYL